MRRDWEFVERKVMEMELPGKRKRGRLKRFLNVVKEDMRKVGAREMDVGTECCGGTLYAMETPD